MQFSVQINASKFFNVNNDQNKVEKYIKFHQEMGLSDTETVLADPHSKMQKFVIDRIKFTKRKGVTTTSTPGFSQINQSWKYTIEIQQMRWEHMMYGSNHSRDITTLQGKLKLLHRDTISDVVQETNENKTKWDEVGYYSEEYNGAWDYVGYRRKSRRIRGLDVFFETKEDRYSRELLEKAKENLNKSIQEEDQRRFNEHKLKFNIDYGNPKYRLYVEKKTGRLMRRIRTGFVSINYTKTTGGKRSCLQDAVINVGALFELCITKEKIYKLAPPSDYSNTEVREVFNLPYVSNQLAFMNIRFKFNKGGNEMFLYKNLRDEGGKYIVLCKIISDRTKRDERHAFVFDADYKNEEKKVKGAIIDNQVHTKLTGIEDSDVKDVNSMRRVCKKLYGVKTFFTQHCWQVFRKY